MIAVGLVLSAVFVPCAFISGITGQFFRQFALTIAVSTIISAFNSLTLSPALTALLLRPRDKADGAAAAAAGVSAGSAAGWAGTFLTPLAGASAWLPAGAGDRGCAVASRRPSACVGRAGSSSRPLNRAAGLALPRVQRRLRPGDAAATRGSSAGCCASASVVLLVYGGLLALTYWQLRRARRKGFIPAQDMGYLLVNVQLPDSASPERTDAVMRQIERDRAGRRPGVRHVTGIAGQSFVLNAVGLELRLDVHQPEGLRRPPRSGAVERRDRQPAAAASSAPRSPTRMVAVFGPPPVRGVGRAGGFTLDGRGPRRPRARRRCRSRPRT